MLFWSALVLFLLAALLAFWFGHLRMDVDFRHDTAHDELSVSVHLLGCRVYKRRIVAKAPAAAVRKHIDAGDALSRVRSLFVRILADLPKWQRFLRPFVFRELNWTTVVGTSDPPLTAMLCGGAWGLKGVMLGAVSQVLHFEKMPRLVVQPRFDGAAFQMDVRCIVAARLGQATYAGWRLFLLVKKS